MFEILSVLYLEFCKLAILRFCYFEVIAAQIYTQTVWNSSVTLLEVDVSIIANTHIVTAILFQAMCSY